MVVGSSYLPAELLQFLIDEMVEETTTLRALREETAKLPNAEWQIPPELGQFLRFLVQLIDARLILEIGTFTGYGSLCMAQAMGKGGRIVTFEGNPEFASLSKKFWSQAGMEGRIEQRLGMALDSLENLVNEERSGTFDLVFIDADKKEYDEYYEYALQLVKDSGLIVVDNMLWKGAVANPEDQRNSTKAIRALMRKIRADKRVSGCLVPIGDGLIIARKL